ncbi:hypothetical protein ACJJTC_018745 [Scirpophaga incertulas]
MSGQLKTTMIRRNARHRRQDRPIVDSNHFPIRTGSKHTCCCICPKKTRTIWKCEECDVNLCIEGCFKAYHSLKLHINCGAKYKDVGEAGVPEELNKKIPATVQEQNYKNMGCCRGRRHAPARLYTLTLGPLRTSGQPRGRLTARSAAFPV